MHTDVHDAPLGRGERLAHVALLQQAHLRGVQSVPVAAAALAAGDPVAAQIALVLAREFVGRDADAAAAIESMSKETVR